MDVYERFALFDDEFVKFDRVVNRRSNRPDLHAFMLLDELFPGEKDIVSAAEHDMIYLGVDIEDVCKLTDHQILELVRCGVMLGRDDDSLYMFA